MKQTFPGDIRPINPETFVGAQGRFFRPVSAEFDGTHTVIEYQRVPMHEMGSRYGHLIDQAVERDALADIFGGASS